MSDTLRQPPESTIKRALRAVDRMQARLDAVERARVEPIAIVGMACRFPGGVDSPDAYWRLLAGGVDAITDVPRSRWDGDRYYDPNPDAPGKMSSRWGGFLADVDRFDSWFFRISPREAQSLDPQHRLLLEAAWEALEDAGLAPDRIAGSAGGVFVGLTTNDYAQLLMRGSGGRGLDAFFFTGNPSNAAAGRIAYTFGLQGPALAIDTACSSSLVAVHQACASLRAGECALALAGGVNLILAPETTIAVSKTRALAADGRCKTFDRAADGFVRSEGCGLVVLKRLSDALADGDPIRALIRGSAVNQDGASSGFTVPNGGAQQAVIRRALGSIPPAAIDYVEAHGTGTALGDPIEVAAAAAVLGEGRDPSRPFYMASVKTQIGHCEAAAGIAGLIKTVLALEHEEIPPHLHFTEPSPHIEWDRLPIRVPVNRTRWARGARPRLAGVSAFGASGTNAHLIVEEAPAPAPHTATRDRPQILPISAKTTGALSALALRYHDRLFSQPSPDLADICYSAAIGRTHHRRRAAIVADSTSDAAAKLKSLADTLTASDAEDAQREPRIAFLFTGQGSQYAGMSRGLYAEAPVFADALDRCADALRAHLDVSLQDLLFATVDGRLNETRYTQPALFSLEYALATLFESWGIRPAAVMGHSVGELAAACIAGVFTLEDGLQLIAERARLMGGLPPGGTMAAVAASEAQVRDAMRDWEPDVSLAALNAPRSVVISGTIAAVSAVRERLAALRIRSAPLAVSHAFHSRLMDPMLDEWTAVAQRVACVAPVLPLVANVTGEMMTAAPDATYWREHARGTVRFASGVDALVAHGCNICVEIGPRPTLVHLASQCRGADLTGLPTLSPGENDWQTLLGAVGGLYARGVTPDWRRLAAGGTRRVVALPTYPFQRKSHWIPERDDVTDKSNDRMQTTTTAAPVRRERILGTLRSYISTLLQAPESEVNVHLPFLEMGADSLVMVEAIGIIEKEFGLKVAIRRFFEDLDTIDGLASFVDAALPPDAAIGAVPADPTAPTSALPAPAMTAVTVLGPDHAPDATALERILAEQNRVMSQFMTQQNDLIRTMLGGASTAGAASVPPVARPVTPTTATLVPAATQAAVPAVPGAAAHPMPWGNPAEIRARGLTDTQRDHLEALLERYTARTPKSKARTQQYRRVLADSRATVGFRLSTKEMLYPIAGARSAGSRMWDVDGNEYIDYTMGFGVHLLGHKPPFVQQAILEEMDRATELGARSDQVGEVAELFTELTGLDRVAFSNSGTEAVMAAVRLARAKTGRDKIAIFTNAYHGHADTTLARAQSSDGTMVSIPMAPGVPARIAEDVLVLDYGTDQALDVLRRRAHELAAVMVEPVQSRHLNLQPRAFLHELRTITREAGAALIFDEMITGFRADLGGAQAYFGVKADLASYGKIVGGGLPIGLVAGSAEFMDGVDGGIWQYGDGSYPLADRTAFGGTFCQHPLSMAAARAVLRHLKAEGPGLQARLNDRTTKLVRALNDYFTSGNIPIQAQNFSSLFRFEFSSNLDLLFYHMLERGIYIWEWRSCFLSTAHTDDDMQRFVDVVQESVDDLRRGGFIPHAPGGGAGGGTTKAPLSEAQKQLWTLLQIEKTGSIAYNVNTTLALHGALNVAHLEAALQRIVDRHSALRTTISPDGVSQIVVRRARVSLPLVDFTDKATADREAAVGQWRADESRQPIDLIRGPLFRPQLLKIAGDHHVLVLTVHHIVADGTTMGVMLSELIAFYNELESGAAAPRPEPMQFSEYIARAEQRRSTPEMRAHEAFWRETFAGGVPALNLPLDHTRPPVKTYAGGRVTRQIEGDAVVALKKAGREHGCTLHMTLMAAFSLLLHRYCRQDDLVVGTSVSGRPFAGSGDVAGYCTHLVPVPSRLAPGATFSTLLADTKRTLLNVLDHQDLPFADLIQILNVPRTADGFPIVSAVFNLEPVSSLPELRGLNASLLPQTVSFTPFDLFVNVFDSGNRLQIDADFNADLFDAPTIERLMASFEVLLAAASTAPRTEARRLPLMSEADRQRLLVEWNRTAEPYPANTFAHTLFEAWAARQPDEIAVRVDGRQIAYGALNAKANQLARALQAQGVGPDVIVAICRERSIEMMIAVLAVLKAGGAYLPIDPSYPQERIDFMLADSGAAITLTASQWPDAASEAAGNLPNAVTGDHAAFVIYTSGSTGQPKGSLNTHGALANLLMWSRDTFGMAPIDRMLNKTSFSFDVCVWEQWSTLTCGACLVMASPGGQRDSQYLAQLIEDERITFGHFVPSMLRLFVDAPEAAAKCRSLRCVISAGEPLPSDLSARFLARFDAALYNSYGPSETAIAVTHWPCSRGDAAGVVPLGHPIANTRLYVLDDLRQPVPIGVAGELHVAGAPVGRGYLHRPELTAERFVSDPFDAAGGARMYSSGDLARYRADGVIEILGRLDHQVKIRGYRIELGEIQHRLLECAGVAAAVVTAERSAAGDTQLVAYVAPEPGRDVQTADLKERLRRTLPDYMVPATIVTLDALPLLPNGKIDRSRLPAQPAAARVAPDGEVERALAEIWGDVLGHGPISVVDDFFALGGHSLSANEVVVRANRDLEARIGIKDVFTHPTVRSLAARIRSASAPDFGPIDPLPAQASYEVSHAQRRFWIHDRMADPAKGNGQPVTFLIDGALDAGALRRAFEALVERHEILRTILVEERGLPVQHVLGAAGAGFLMSESDVSASGDVDDALGAIERREASVRIDLAKGPLFRVHLARLAANRHACICTLHHIATDGWSIGVLVNELTRLYDAFADADADPLPPLRIQYKEFAAWQRQILDSDRSKAMREYWQGKLAGGPARLDLPTDVPRAGARPYQRGTRRFTIDRALSEALRATAQRQGATLFMALLAAIKIVLYRYTAQEDICVGTPVAGRVHADLEGQIGPYLNVLPLRDTVAAEDALATVIYELRQTTLDGYAHQLYPFDRLVDDLQVKRDAGRNPFFDVGFTLHNQDDVLRRRTSRHITISERTQESPWLEHDEAATDLWFFARAAEGGLASEVVYNASLFEGATIDALIADLLAVVAAGGADPDVKVGAIVLAGGERRRPAPAVTIHLGL